MRLWAYSYICQRSSGTQFHLNYEGYQHLSATTLTGYRTAEIEIVVAQIRTWGQRQSAPLNGGSDRAARRILVVGGPRWHVQDRLSRSTPRKARWQSGP